VEGDAEKGVPVYDELLRLANEQNDIALCAAASRSTAMGT
jgi:hypothetical protein